MSQPAAAAPAATSLYQQFRLRLLPLLLLAFVLTAAVTAATNYYQFTQQEDKRRNETLQAFAQALLKPLWDCDGTASSSIVEAMTQLPHVQSVRVQDLCNARSISTAQSINPLDLDMREQTLHYSDERGRSFHVGELALGFSPMSFSIASSSGLWQQLIIFASMLVAVMLSAAWVFERIVGRPLARLRQAMRSHRELPSIPASWAQEVREVCQTYNHQVQELRRQARHDPLTGLGNRMLLNEHLAHAITRAQRQGTHGHVLLLDLNWFKAINDTHGHAAGDAVLKIVAQRLRECVRESDLVARLGGDEFVVLSTDLSGANDIETLLARIKHAVIQPIAWEGHALQVGVSIGVAQFLRDGCTSAALLAHADAAMYGDKQRER